MKGVYLFTIALFFSFLSFSQVGIGTTNPSTASVLDISSAIGNTSYGGLMPPRVVSQNERNAISATSIDLGLLIFVLETGTFEVWNGIFWETIYTLSTQAQTLAFQDFDSNLTWSYSVSPYFYSIGTDIWNTVTTLGSGTQAIDNVSNNFLGCRDLNNSNGGGNMPHEIVFANVDISSIINARISFDYDVYEFDNGDDVSYEVFYDDVGQGLVTFINGTANFSEEGTITLHIPGSVTNVRLTLSIQQNGDNDYAGFDNFRVYGE